jgi:hypothetical protein
VYQHFQHFCTGTPGGLGGTLVGAIFCNVFFKVFSNICVPARLVQFCDRFLARPAD